MTDLTDSQYQMLKDYAELLSGMREGFYYLEANLTEEAPPQVLTVFNDLLAAFEQVHKCHSQMVALFSDNERINPLIAECKDIIVQLTMWFKIESNDGKKQLLTNKVIPAFDDWKKSMDQFLFPYLVH